MDFSQHSRVWIYQSNRELTNQEVARIKPLLDSFTADWTAHNDHLKAKAEVRYNRFIILVVDETKTTASGCSIDKSVKLMKEIEQTLGIDLFDRFNVAYKDNDKVHSSNREEFEMLIKMKKVNNDTVVFNNLVQTLDELDTKWEVKLGNSWHSTMFGTLGS